MRIPFGPALAAALAAVLAPVVARAGDPAPAAEGPPTGAAPNPTTDPRRDPAALFGMKQAMTASFGAGKIDGDYYLQASATLDLDLGDVGAGFAIPLNFLVYSANEPPTRDEKTYFHVLRKADYPKLSKDTWGQYLRMLRFVRFGQKRDDVYVYFGQMFGATIGHGTIVDRYNNSLDLTKPHNGLAFDLNTKWGGFETLVNDVAWPSTTLAGARAYVKPFGAKETPLLSRWAIGFSAVTDRTAPRALASATSDGAGRECTSGCNGIASDGTAQAADARPFSVYGIDTEFPVFSNSVLTLIPYADLNFQPLGAGAHIGVLGNFRFPIFGALKLWSRLELRVMQPRYIPDYFDVAYDQQRYVYPVGEASMPKAEAAYALAPNGNTGAPLTKGYFGEATAEVLGIVQAGAMFSQTPGVPNSANFMLFATLPKFETVKLSAYYLRKNFDKPQEIIQLDERSVLTASALYQIFGPLYLMGVFHRSWRTDAVTGQIKASNDWDVGIQTYVPL